MKHQRRKQLRFAVLGLILGWGMAWWPKPKPMQRSQNQAGLVMVDSSGPAAISIVSAATQCSSAGFRALLDNPRFNQREVWMRWATIDPVSCYAEMVKSTDWEFVLEVNPLPDEVIMSLFSTWVEQDPAAALKALVEMPPIFRATLALPELLCKLVARDPLQALKYIRSHGEHVTSFVLPTLVWGPVDFPSLARVASDLGNGCYCEYFLEELACQYAKKSPEAALSWVRSLHRRNKPDLLREVFAAWTQSAPQQAMSFLMQATDPVERQVAAVPLAEQLVKEAPENAWAAAQQAGLLREMHMVLARSWAKQDLPSAMRFFLSLDSEYLPDVIMEDCWPWRTLDDKSNREIAMKLPMGAAKKLIIREMMDSWPSEEAAQFLLREPQLDEDGRLANIVICSLSKKDPARALAWFWELPEVTQILCSEGIGGIFYDWSSKDPAAAQAAAEAIQDQRQRKMALDGILFQKRMQENH